MFLSLPSMRKEEKRIFEQACSSLEVNKFVSDELQPDDEFHGLLNNAIDPLYRKLQKGWEYTNYGIHNLIKVTAETAPCPSPQALNYRCSGLYFSTISQDRQSAPALVDTGCISKGCGIGKPAGS